MPDRREPGEGKEIEEGKLKRSQVGGVGNMKGIGYRYWFYGA